LFITIAKIDGEKREEIRPVLLEKSEHFPNSGMLLI
jgi:hypothetical protein